MGRIAQEKHTILNAMVKDNISTNVIAKTLGYTPEHTSRLKTKSKQYQLVTTKRIKTAVKAIEYFADVKNYQEDTRIKPSDVLAAGKEILDRSHPKQQQDTHTAVNISLLLQSAHKSLLSIDNNNNPIDNTIDIPQNEQNQ